MSITPRSSSRWAFTPRALTPLTALLSGCFLFGGGAGRSGSSLPVEATDTAQAYRDHLARQADDPAADRYRARMAELELIEARTRLRPLLDPSSTFSASAGESGWASLASGTQMIFEQAEEGWLGFQVVRIAPDLDDQANVRLFARAGESVSLGTGTGKRGRYFSIEDEVGIPLVRTASFEATLVQQHEYGGGMSFCFFSSSPDSCEDGYRFTYDKAHFQAYQLATVSGGESSPLCAYQMDPNNTQHSDSITVDNSSGRAALRDPKVQISAHHGYLSVHFNGRQICHVKDETFSEGYFVMQDAPAISTLDIQLNAGSSTVFALAENLIDIQTGEPLGSQSGAHHEAYNAFVTDYNAYLAVQAGGDFPESFTHVYFESFFDMGEADDAYVALEGNQDMAAYVAYLEAYPRNSHKKQIQKTLFDLARELNTFEAYQTFQAQYPDSSARLDINKRIGDLQWSTVVKKANKKYLTKYLEQSPQGYHARRAELMLEGLEYHAQNKAEVDTARKLIASAQTAVNKSPVTSQWDVEIVDYLAGSLYFNLNSGPAFDGPAPTASLHQAQETILAQEAAYLNTCEMLKKRFESVEFCMVAWSFKKGTVYRANRVGEVILEALDGFYLPRIKRGDPVDMTQVLALLDRMREAKSDREYEEAMVMIPTYMQLGMPHEAAYTFYLYALAVPKRSHVTSAAETVVKNSPSLAHDPDFLWVVQRLGE